MTPYLEYPQLLSVLLRMLNEGEGSVHIRREVLKVRRLALWVGSADFVHRRARRQGWRKVIETCAA